MRFFFIRGLKNGFDLDLHGVTLTFRCYVAIFLVSLLLKCYMQVIVTR